MTNDKLTTVCHYVACDNGGDTLTHDMPTYDNEGFWIGDRYCGLFRISSGGMGEVWVGKAMGDRGFERPVAIKRILSHRRRKESYHRAIIDEASVLQHLSASPNIVSIIDLREEGGQPYLIMEYIDGSELRDVIVFLQSRKAKLPLPLSFYIAIEISKGLSSAHECKHPKTGESLNIIHRDVSPSNVMLSSLGAVKLADFGIAKHQLQTSETQVGEIKGKFRYMAPEQARGGSIDYRVDYFALGLNLYECLVGRPAYEAETDAQMIELARNGKIPYPEQTDRDLLAILHKLLAFNPGDRYQDLEQFRQKLGQAAMHLGGVATSEDLSKFLGNLNLPQHRAAVRRRKRIEKSKRLPPKSKAAAAADTQTTGAWWRGGIRRPAAIIAAAVVITIGVAVGGAWWIQKSSGDLKTGPVEAADGPRIDDRAGFISRAAPKGTIDIRTEPSAADIVIRHKKRKIELASPALLSDIPLDTPVHISISKPGYQEVSKKITLTRENPRYAEVIPLKKKPSIAIRFTAIPPSQVTVPGRFKNLDAPSPLKKMPAGTYRVIFSNPLTSSKAIATLAADGGSYVCSANMQIDPTSGQSTGKAPTAWCRKSNR